MMAKSHVTSAACVGSVVTIGGGLALFTPLWAERAVAIAVYLLALGFFHYGSVAPDHDQKGSSVNRSWGLVTGLLGWLSRVVARAVWWATRTERDVARKSMHRFFTHTWPGAVLYGGAVAWAMDTHPITAAVVAAMASGTAAYCFDKDLQIWAAILGGSLGVFTYGYGAWPVWWVAVTLGCLLHDLGDCPTKMGAPWRFPFVDQGTGRRWEMYGPPEWMRFTTGSSMETLLVWSMVITSAWLCWMIAVA